MYEFIIPDLDIFFFFEAQLSLSVRFYYLETVTLLLVLILNKRSMGQITPPRFNTFAQNINYINHNSDQ